MISIMICLSLREMAVNVFLNIAAMTFATHLVCHPYG